MPEEIEVDSKTILIGRCSHDNIVKYPYYWMEKIITEAKRLNFNVIDLKDINFERKKLKKLLKDKQPFLVILCGHGHKHFIQGHNNKTIVELCNEDYLFKDKIVYAISCYTSKALGKSAKTKGCKNYIGWDNNLEITAMKDTEPEQDYFAQPCMEAMIQIPISILNGDSINIAYNKYCDKFNEWISKWRADIRYTLMASMLEEIRDHLLID